MEKLQELFTDRVNNTLWATKKHFYDKFEVEQNLNRLDMLKLFIQWLVEKNKIDTQNLITYMNWTSLTFNKVPSTDCTNIDKTWNNFYTECLLMLLAIQDKPIEFLVSILK